MNKIFFFAVILASIFLIPITPAKADSYFESWFDILNDPTFGWHQAQFAPSTLNLTFFSYSYNDTSDTRVKFDCNSDGTYEIDRTISINPTYAYRGEGNDYFVVGGDFYRYVEPRSPQHAYWASITNRSINCYYPLPGNYTITMVAERNGVKVTANRSFNLREPAVEMQARPFYNNNIIGTITGSGGRSWEGGIPVAPADIDLGVAIYNPITYSTCSSCHWPLFTSSATLKLDCDSDGKDEKTVGYSTTSNASRVGWDPWCKLGGYFSIPDSSCYSSIANSLNWYSKACHYDKPGIYKATVKAELPRTGAEPYTRSTSTDFIVLPKDQASVDFSTGNDPNYGQAPLNGVDLKLDVSGLIWTHASYKFSCGNGQSANYSIAADFSKRNYEQDYSYTSKDLCNYTSPGDYTAKAQIEFNTVNLPGGIRNTLPFNEVRATNNYITYSLEKTIRIVVTGKVSETEYIVTSPFDLRWNASRVSSCSIAGVGNNFSASGSGSDTINVSNVPTGEYRYKLACTSSGGVTVDKTIKVTVVPSP